MIREITKYPNLPTVEFAVDVRAFNEELFSFIDDLKDTITEYNLDGLAATQLGSYLSVIVIKDKVNGGAREGALGYNDDEFLELINPRILNKKGEITTTETTAYYGDMPLEITRYDNISLVYEDREGKQKSLKTSGSLSILIQRKIDYLFGVNFTSKLNQEEKMRFESGLASETGESCPTTQPIGFGRDWFVHGANYMMIAMLLLLGVSFFIDDTETLGDMWNYQLYMSFVVVLINIAYILYSYYENKKFSICTNCYNMSIFGVVAMGLFRVSMLMIASYFLI